MFLTHGECNRNTEKKPLLSVNILKNIYPSKMLGTVNFYTVFSLWGSMN